MTVSPGPAFNVNVINDLSVFQSPGAPVDPRPPQLQTRTSAAVTSASSTR